MSSTLHLRVITPDSIALDTHVTSMRIPALDGLLGILPRHAAMVAALDIGAMNYEENGSRKQLFVCGGFAEVAGQEVRVVTQAGEKPEEIDEARARQAEARARERLRVAQSAAAGEVDQLRAELALKRALMRLRVLTDR